MLRVKAENQTGYLPDTQVTSVYHSSSPSSWVWKQNAHSGQRGGGQ